MSVTVRPKIGHDDRVWLAIIELPTRYLYVATEKVEVTKADGSILAFDPGLQPLQFSIDEGSVFDRSIRVAINTPDDWSEFRQTRKASGFFWGFPAKVIRWRPGEVLEQAEVIVNGATVSPAWGYKGDGLEVTIDSRADDNVTLLLDPGKVVDLTTQPVTGGTVIDDSILGTPYPMPIGFPGDLGSVRVGAMPLVFAEFDNTGTPKNSRLIVSGYPILASEIEVFDYSSDTLISESLPIQTAEDLQGQTYYYVDFSTSSSLATVMAPGRRYMGAFSKATGGGIPSPFDQSKELTTANELFAHFGLALSRKNHPFDVHSQLAQAHILDAYKIDTFLNTQGNISDWLDQLADILPVTKTMGPSGFYWQAWPYRATKKDARAHLVASQQRMQLSGRITLTSEPTANQIIVNYGNDWTQSGFVQRVIMQGTPNIQDKRYLASYRCYVSELRHGKSTLEISAPMITDAATAGLVARDKAIRNALHRSVLPYQYGRWAEDFNLGDVVTLTDDRLHLSEQLAFFRSVPRDGGDIILELLEDPRL